MAESFSSYKYSSIQLCLVHMHTMFDFINYMYIKRYLDFCFVVFHATWKSLFHIWWNLIYVYYSCHFSGIKLGPEKEFGKQYLIVLYHIHLLEIILIPFDNCVQIIVFKSYLYCVH